MSAVPVVVEATQSYAESKQKPPFDWNKFLATPFHTDDEWDAAARLSGTWVTCACGNQCAVLPRNSSGCPDDNKLFWLGIEFNSAICERDVAMASSILAAIESRSAQLLAAM